MSKLINGLIAGVVIGILIAPDKGSKTRERINRAAANVKDKFNGLVGVFSGKSKEEEDMYETEIIAVTVVDNENAYSSGGTIGNP